MPSLDLAGIDLDMVRGEVSRRSLKEFVKLFWKALEPGSPFIDGWVIDAICDHLAHLKDVGNLLINCPPRCGKSNLVAVFFPAWQWLHRPEEKFLYSSYTVNNAERDSVKCRRLIESDLFRKLYGTTFELSGDQNTKRNFGNNKAGERIVTSVEGSTTGTGGTICCHDDPHAVDEADSEAKRNIAIRWLTDTWLNRLNPGGTGRIVCGQRIHRNDVSGYILENYKSEWTHLLLPYEFKRSVAVPTRIGWHDPRKEEGEPLWPERFSQSEINQLKKKPRTWSGQYNQNPVDVTHALFKPEDFQSFDERDDCYLLNGRRVSKADTWRIMSTDLAIALHNRADYTAIVVADICRSGDIVVKHVVRERISGTKIVQELVKVNETFQPAYILVEDVGFQKVILDQARAEGLPVRGIRPGSADKEGRSIPLQGRFESRQVWFPRDAHWVSAIQTELIEFPNGAHDDMCFVAGTMIETIEGPMPVERIKPGMRVLTRRGYCPVLASGPTGIRQTRTVTLADGRKITGTNNHPFWVEGKNWVPMHSITPQDIILAWNQQLSNTGAGRTGDTPIPNDDNIGSIIRSIQKTKADRCICIGRYGRMRTDLFPMAGTFTTKTGTHSTTTLPTWIACQAGSIGENTGGWELATRRLSGGTWTGSGHLPKPGTDRRKDGPGIENTASKPGKAVSQWTRSVMNAEQTSSPCNLGLCIAPGNVPSGPGGNQALTMNGGLASAAESPSRSTSMPRPGLVPVRVLKNCEGETRQVYNLAVAEAHEYFANGILVHNCDALSYLADEANKRTRQRPAPKEAAPAKSYDQIYQEALLQGIR